jgi:ABC-type branched-subunit amino acid transport system substrate-binding protein
MSRQIDRRSLIRGIGAAGAVGLAGCLDGGGGSGREIQLGMVMGVTGGLAELGPPIRDASTLVVDQVNDADTGFSVDSQFEDSATDPSQGVSGAEALVNAGYPMICGALSSGVTIQVAESVAIPNQTVMCSPASTSPDITDLDDDGYIYRTAATDALQGQVLARIAAEEIGASSASTFYLNNAYGSGLSGGFSNSFQNEYDGEITDQVSFTEGESSYTSRLEQALSGEPDTMLIVGYPESGVRILRDFYSNFDGDMPLLVADGLQDSSLPDNVGQDLTNVQGTAPIGEGPGLEYFNQAYGDAYDADPAGQPFIRQAYDAAATLVLANAAAGENDGTAVRDNMQAVTAEGGSEVTPDNLVEGIEMAANGDEINYQGVAGPVEFDDNGDLATASYEHFEFTSDGLEVVGTLQP